ncbi:MAG: hypothetical protein GX060_03820 [Firmicutes bacterium]|nr:hypothetical protein [Bacillota bacterium]
MDTLMVWLFLSFTVERIVELILCLIPQLDAKRQIAGINVPGLLAFVVALVLSYGAQLDFFQMFGVSFQWPAIGPLLSAFFMVGGSGVIHDLIGWVNAAKENSRAFNGKM